MRICLWMSVLFVTVLTGPASSAQDKGFGLGIILGEPTGISAKLWRSSTTAYDVGLGWSSGADRIGSTKLAPTSGTRIHIHANHLWHMFDVIRSRERFPVYYGVGGRLNGGGGYGSSLAVRGVAGIAWLSPAAPVDIFFEIAPSVQLTPSTGLTADAGLGARWYFR